MNTWKKLTQKADHFTVFESFPSTSCCSQKFPLNKIEKFGWLEMWGSIRDVFIGFVVGDGLTRKGYCSKFYVVGTIGHYWSSKPTWMGGAGSLISEMKQNLHLYTALWMFGLLKQAAILDIASPGTCQVPETTIWALHITVNSPLLQSASDRWTQI